jgi:hypothetical protein
MTARVVTGDGPQQVSLNGSFRDDCLNVNGILSMFAPSQLMGGTSITPDRHLLLRTKAEIHDSAGQTALGPPLFNSLILDTRSWTEYHHSALGRVKDPVILPDFKGVCCFLAFSPILLCWGLFFLHISEF